MIFLYFVVYALKTTTRLKLQLYSANQNGKKKKAPQNKNKNLTTSHSGRMWNNRNSHTLLEYKMKHTADLHAG